MMKKILSFAIVGLCVLLLTGCFGGETETLRCVRNTDEGGFEAETTRTIEIRNGRIISSESSIISTPNSIMEEYLEYYIEVLESREYGYGALKTMSGVTFTSEVRNGSHHLDIKIDFNNVDAEEIRLATSPAIILMFADHDNDNVSVQRIKESLGQQRFICE